MKKRVFLPTILTLSVILSGCSTAQPSPSGNSAELESLQAQVKALQEENASLKEQLNLPPESIPEENAAPQQGTVIAIGDTITTDYAEITINKVELTYDVLPDDTSGFYTHYEADSGNVYLHLDLDVKNLGKQNLGCDEILSATADYNGAYTYTGFAVSEDSNTGFTYANITSIKPLETLGVHFLFKCPQEVEESTNPLFITLEPASTKDSYVLTIR